MSLGQLDARFTGATGVANRLITKYGGSVTLVYKTGGTYDKATMTATGEGTITNTVSATPPQPYRTDEIDGTTLQTGDLRTYIPSHQVTSAPPKGASVTVDGEQWRIMETNPVKSGNDVCMYELQLRRI